MNTKYGKDPTYMQYVNEEGIMPNHLGSTVLLPDGNVMFLKKGKEDTNPELHWETDEYHSGKMDIKKLMI